MGLIKTVKGYEVSFDDFWGPMDDLYKAILMLPNSDDRDKMIAQYGRVTACREQLWESKDRLIDAIESCVGLV